MKKILLVSIGAIAMFMLLGCNATDKVRIVTENTYSVIKESQTVLGIIKDELYGSAAWVRVEPYTKSLSEALTTIEDTLVKIAPMVGANLVNPPKMQASGGTANLDSAVEKLRKSVE